jgi:hypothetical protein
VSVPHWEAPLLDAKDEASVRLAVRTLEHRAALSRQVVIYDKLARSIARHLRRMLDSTFHEPQ